ncbi:FecR family protein [Zunongwangia endophytica]|uniref:FecR family protein n=1 Tax=Zunongwangia endophytica TaxID=1808945 RepID=A0ABV8H4N6_9FLAO|nr:FecR family protein [Zunongwangia endophytica]MDN3595517.1 FecR family protein [Zunongwangia endophytica]
MIDKDKIDAQFDEYWKEKPLEHSQNKKEKSWKDFHQTTIKKKRTKRPFYLKYAAAVIVLILAGSFYLLNQPQQTSASIVNISNPSDHTKVIHLPDSTEIRLYPHSKISYHKNYNKNRLVTLDGDAFFQVKKDKHHPFEVHNNNLITTVLGTTFTITTDLNKKTEVKLYEGKIKMNIEGQSESWILSPGEEFSYQKNTPEINHIKTYVDFENEKLKTIITYLEKEYGFDIQLEALNLNKETTLRINKEDHLETPLQIITEIHNLTYEIDMTRRKVILKK